MPGPKGYDEGSPSLGLPPGSSAVVTSVNLTTDVSVVGNNNDHSVKVGTLLQTPIAGNETTWRPEAAATATGVTVKAGDPTGAGAGGALTLEGGEPSAGVGGAVTINGADGAGGNNAGGAIALNAGDSAGSGKGGSISCVAGAAGPSGAGGDISLTAGAGGATSGNGGTITITGGPATDGNGGDIWIAPGAGAGTDRSGGNVSMTMGAATGTGAAGSATINGGNAGTVGSGGGVSITGGAGGTVSGAGGVVSIQGGTGTLNANGGDVNITGGNPNGSGIRGLINFTGSRTFNTNEVTLNSNQDNYTGGDGYGVLKINATGNFDLTGLASPVSGRQLIIYNTGASTVTLKHDATSTAANRFYLPGAADLAIAQYSGVIVEYAPTVARWVVVGMSVSSSGGGGGGFSTICYVDVAGDDATGVRGDPSKPFLTVNAALAATTTAGDTVLVGPGTFASAITWDTENRNLCGSGAGVTVLGNITSSLTGGASTSSSFKNFSCGTFSLTSTKGGASILTLDFANISSGSATITGRSNGQDRINCANFSVPSASFTVVNVPGNYVGVRADGVLDITNNTSRVTSLEACNCDGGTLTLSGSGQINVAGGAYSDLTCNNGGTFLVTGCLVNGNTTINSTCTVSVSGCRLAGSITVASGATFVPKGCNFAASGLTSSAAPGTVNLTYWGGTVVVTAAATLTLPARAHNGYVINVKNGNAAGSGNNVTIARNGNNIDGAASDAVIGPLQSLTLIGDGTNWWAI